MSNGRQKPPEALIGDVVAGHRIEAVVGRGGHAVIYRAFDTRLERVVALKLIDSAALETDPQLTERFRIEIDLVKRLEHPNIVRLYAFGVTDDGGRPWMTMELLDGTTLRQRLDAAAGRKLTPEHALDITLQILEGLAVAHEQDIVHCDLKPDNIILVRKGVSRELAKILDFGVGKALTADQSAAEAMTATAATPRYMAPELLLGVPATPATDVHGVGLLLYEMLAGHSALQGESTDEILRHVASGAVIELPPQLQDTDLGTLLARALAPEPFDRFADAAEMYAAVEHLVRATTRSGVADLRRTLNELPAVTLPSPTEAQPALTRRLTLRAVAMGLVVGSVLIGIGAAGTWWTIQRDDAPRPAEPDVPETPPTPQPEPPPPYVWPEAHTTAVLHGVTLGTAQLATSLPDPLRVALAPTMDADILLTELDPVRELLADALRRPVQMQVADSYEDLARIVAAGEADIGTFPPMLYVESTRDPDHGLGLLAFEAFEGASTSDGYLLVNERSAVSVLDDLAGKRFCFTDPSSTTGYALPRHWLRSRGLDLETTIAGVHWSGSHLQVMRDLVDGHCDVAATYSGAFLSARDNGIAVGRMRIFAITGRSPQTAWVAAPDLEANLADGVRDALLGVDPPRDLAMPRIGDSLRITGFVPASEETYDTLRAIDAEREPTP